MKCQLLNPTALGKGGEPFSKQQPYIIQATLFINGEGSSRDTNPQSQARAAAALISSRMLITSLRPLKIRPSLFNAEAPGPACYNREAALCSLFSRSATSLHLAVLLSSSSPGLLGTGWEEDLTLQGHHVLHLHHLKWVPTEIHAWWLRGQFAIGESTEKTLSRRAAILTQPSLRHGALWRKRGTIMVTIWIMHMV